MSTSTIIGKEAISKSEGIQVAAKNENDVLKNLNPIDGKIVFPKETLHNTPNVTNEEIDAKFREINFSYPVWKPNNKIRSMKDLEFIKKEYEKLGENNQKKELNINA